MPEPWIRILQSLTGVGFDLLGRWRANRSWPYSSLSHIRNIASYGLQPKPTRRLLTVQDLSIFALLLHFGLPHLTFLLPLQLLPLPGQRCVRGSFLLFNILLHLLLVDLPIKDSLVWILHLVLIHSLLFDLLGGLRASLFLANSVGLLILFLLLLLLNSEVSHVFRVDMSLLVESGTLCG